MQLKELEKEKLRRSNNKEAEIIKIIAEINKIKNTKIIGRDFPCGPVVRTLHSQCRGPGFNPWLGN